MTSGEVRYISNPVEFPDAGAINEVREPYIDANILLPAEYVGPVMELYHDKRGTFKDMEYLSTDRVRLEYDLPLAEIVLDFFDLLKTRSRGYASLDYEIEGFRAWRSGPARYPHRRRHRRRAQPDRAQGQVHTASAGRWSSGCARRSRGRCSRWPSRRRWAAGSSPARACAPLRKDVLAKCYGGDITPQAQAAREAEGRQEAHEDGGHGRDPAGGVPGRARPGRQGLTP